jgi:hypothetical protein
MCCLGASACPRIACQSVRYDGGEMRAVVSTVAVAALLAITAFCPLWTCVAIAQAGTHSCCPRSGSPERPPKCDTTSETCPYLLLQKAKGITLHLALPPIQAAALVPLPQAVESVEFTAVYLPDVSGLYLRNRVLLI